jgi:hypothetical protein
MRNLRMEEKLKSGDCLDVRKEGSSLGGGRFQLARFVEYVDYCDAETESWIWSIGRNESGTIFASTSAEFYQNEAFECLFLR